jgi:hypothetical protein
MRYHIYYQGHHPENPDIASRFIATEIAARFGGNIQARLEVTVHAD